MALCNPCSELKGEPGDRAPHGALVKEKRIDLGRASRGQTTGEWIFWKCSTCGSLLQQDLDEKDAEAQWGVVKEG